MRTFFYYLTLGVAVRACAASIPGLHPLRPASRGLATRPSQEHNIVSSNLVDHLARRGSISCPEEIGGQPMSCASTLCGGEDPANAGHCTAKNLLGGQCQCKSAYCSSLTESAELRFRSGVNDGSTAAPVLSVVTATQSGQTVTGTYVLETILSYSELRQSITTTVTVTATSNGVAEVKTAAAVVLAGGVSWFLAGTFVFHSFISPLSRNWRLRCGLD